MPSRHSISLAAAMIFAGVLPAISAAAPKPPPPPASAATATAPQTPATATAPAVPQDPFTQDLLTRLSSTDPAQRAAAQQQLATIAGYWQQPEILQKMSDATANQEIKAAISQRLNDLKTQQAEKTITHLPPLSLNVTNATLAQLVTALNDTFSAANKIQLVTGGTGTFTLAVKDKPFWEIFTALAQQQPLTLASSNTGLRLSSTAPGLRRFAIDGPAIAFAGAINYRRSVALQTPNGDQPVQPALTVAVSMAVDPRIKVMRYGYLTLRSAVDDAGHDLARPGAVPAQNYVAASSNLHNQTFSLVPPAALGKTMTLTCDARIVAQTSEIVSVISDVQNSLNKPVTVGAGTFRISRFDIQPQTLTLQITATSVQTNPTRATHTLFDSAGKAVWTVNAPSSVSASIASGASTGPYKLEIRVPDKSVEIPVHFALKDIPLP